MPRSVSTGSDLTLPIIFSIVPFGDGGSKSETSLHVLSRITKKQTDIAELLKENGCCQCELDRSSSSTLHQSFQLLLSFNNLESLNRLVAVTGASDLPGSVNSQKKGTEKKVRTRVPASLQKPPRTPSYEHMLLSKLHNIIFSETWTDFGETFQVKVDVKELENLKQAVKFFTFGQSSPSPRDDLPEQAKQDDVNWKLWVCAQRGNPHKVQECIDLGADVNFYGGKMEYSTALHEAVNLQDIETCKVLLNASANVNLKSRHGGKEMSWSKIHLGANVANNRNGQTALFFAKSGEICELLLRHGAQVDVIDDVGWTPLLHAVASQECSVQVVKSLIKAHADVNKGYPTGETMITLGLQHQSNEIQDKVEALAAAGADLEVLNQHGLTPLLAAVSVGHIEMTKLLLKCGANIHARDEKGNSVLHILLLSLSAHGRSSRISSSRTIDLFQVLETAGAEVAALNEGGCTVTNVLLRRSPSHCTSANLPDVDLVSLKAIHSHLFSHFMLKTADKDGNTLLHIAARECNATTCQFLISCGAEINAENNDGDTTLHVARGDLEKFQYLLEAGADVLAVNLRKETPLHTAARNGSKGCIIDELLAEKAFLHARDVDMCTPFLAAMKGTKFKTACCFINVGANVSDVNKTGKTALHYAAEKYDHGSSIYIRDVRTGEDKLTPEQHILGLLLQIRRIHLSTGEAAIDINALDSDGNTPLHLAAKAEKDFNFGRHQANCYRLMNAGANALILNKAGNAALDVFGKNKPEFAPRILQGQMKQRLLLEGKTKMDKVKLFLIGEPGAGKSTLKNTLTNRKVSGQQGYSNQDDNDSSDYTPTAGIDLGHYSIDGAGNFSIWDYAGHEEFHVTHSLFLGGDNAIFLVAYDLSKLADEKDQQKAKEYYEKLKYWLSFVKAGNSPSRADKPYVLLVGTHIDQVHNKDEGARNAKKVFEDLRDFFKGSLNISDCSVALDCRTNQSEEMASLISELRKLGDTVKGETEVPSLCEEIKTKMTKWYNRDYPVLTMSEFSEKVKQQHGILEDQLLHTATEYLHQMGEIYIVRSASEKILVVLNPQWFCNDVIAPAFAGESFLPFMNNTLEDKMEYTLEDFVNLYPEFPNYGHLITFLKQLDLIYEVDKNRYVMPVKLKCKKDELWKEDDTMTEYYGRRVECTDGTDIFSADVFPCFQVAMMREFSQGKKPVISLNELKISQAVEGYVELIPDMQAIQYYVRGRGDRDTRHCQDMLTKIEAMIDRELENRSPGTCTTKKYLSSSEVKNLKNLKNVRSYTKEQLMEAISQNKGIVCEGKTHNTDQVAAIICKGFDMIFLEAYGVNCKLKWGMTKQVQHILADVLDTTSCWRDDYRGLAEACKISDSVLDQFLQQRGKTSVTLAILQKWGETEKGHTVGDLLHILSIPGLVDNHMAKSAIIRMLSDAGYDVQIPEKIPEGISINSKVLVRRAALRQIRKLPQCVQASQLWLHVQSCFSEKTEEVIEKSMEKEREIGKVEEIINHLLQLREPDWWDKLMEGARVDSKSNSLRHFAEEFTKSLDFFMSLDMFKSLK